MKKNICPICGKKNNCQFEKKEDCWCKNITISSDLLKQVPNKAQGKACICIDCIETFK